MADWPTRPGFSRMSTRRSACSALIRSPARIKKSRACSYDQRCAHAGELGWGGTNCAKARSEEHTSELQSLMRISYAVFCLKKKKQLNKVPRCNTTHMTRITHKHTRRT